MKALAKTLFWSSLFAILVPIVGVAQTFELPEARVGEQYRVQIGQVLRDVYRLKLETGRQDAVIQWALENGDLPPGLSVRNDGFILGKADASSDRAFAFRLRAHDTAAKNDALVLEFLINLKGGGLRLVKFEGPTLKPIDEPRKPESNGAENQNGDNGSESTNKDGDKPLEWVQPKKDSGDKIPDFTQSKIDLGLKVNKDSICMLYVKVEDGTTGKVFTSEQKVDRDKETQRIKATLAKGLNKITVTPHAKKDLKGDCPAEAGLANLDVSKADEITLEVNCNGLDCGKAPPAAASGNGENGENGSNVSQNPFSSRNRRFIVGFEQSGAASAESKGQPFLDLFFTAPLPWGRNGQSTLDAIEDKARPFARFSIWGNVKLNSTPQQIASLANVTSNAVSSITEGKVNKLTLGFEFVAGPEIRLAKAGRTHISFIGGFGAVTPLAPTQATQIFKTPDPTSSQAERFFSDYPGAKGKQFIGFTTPERDRFLRQYFGGFRFKTYRYSKEGELLDQFPGMFDVTFGQNEAVTGGTFHKFVVGLEGFYALPFPEGKRFLFLFGSAKFKAGGPKTKQVPFVLDTAESSVLPTNPNVFLADPTPSNRDVYRIGFGVDLIEVFKAATAAGKKKEEPKD